MSEQLSDDLKSQLDLPVFITVATVQPDGSPQLSPVWVKRDGDDVIFSTTVGRQKEKNLRRDPRVTVLLIAPIVVIIALVELAPGRLVTQREPAVTPVGLPMESVFKTEISPASVTVLSWFGGGPNGDIVSGAC